MNHVRLLHIHGEGYVLHVNKDSFNIEFATVLALAEDAVAITFRTARKELPWHRLTPSLQSSND